MNLVEQYRQRLSVSEGVYQKSNNGAKLDNNRKLMIAQSLKNTSEFLTEAFTSVDATQRDALNGWKKFCL